MSHAVDQLIRINFLGPNEVLSLNIYFLKITLDKINILSFILNIKRNNVYFENKESSYNKSFSVTKFYGYLNNRLF